MAHALRQLFVQSNQVIILGTRSRMDSFGAAVGHQQDREEPDRRYM